MTFSNLPSNSSKSNTAITRSNDDEPTTNPNLQLLKLLFSAREQRCQLTAKKVVPRSSMNQQEDTSRLKQRRKKKAQQQSVICVSCNAEYHINCLIQAFKDFKRGQTKSQKAYAKAKSHQAAANEKRGAYNKPNGQSGTQLFVTNKEPKKNQQL